MIDDLPRGQRDDVHSRTQRIVQSAVAWKRKYFQLPRLYHAWHFRTRHWTSSSPRSIELAYVRPRHHAYVRSRMKELVHAPGSLGICTFLFQAHRSSEYMVRRKGPAMTLQQQTTRGAVTNSEGPPHLCSTMLLRFDSRHYVLLRHPSPPRTASSHTCAEPWTTACSLA
jgi:hypothetical protein